MRKEPKLRPSMSWADMQLCINALTTVVTTAIKSKQVTRAIMESAKVRDYLETFKPEEESISEIEQLAKLMKKFGIENVPVLNDVSTTIKEIDLSNPIHKQFGPALKDPEPLTNDERYDMLKLAGEGTYTEDDKIFMLNVGTMIMMNRAMGKKVNTGDL
jgi:hypothetical protein